MMQSMVINKYPYFIAPSGQTETQQFTAYNISTMPPHISQSAPYFQVHPSAIIPGTHLISPYSMTPQQIRFQTLQQQQQHLPLIPMQQQHIHDLKLNADINSASSTESTSPALSQSPNLAQQNAQNKIKHLPNNEATGSADEDRINKSENRKNQKPVNSNKQQYNIQQQYNIDQNNRNMIQNFMNIRNTAPLNFQGMPSGQNHFIQPIQFYNNDRNLNVNTPPPVVAPVQLPSVSPGVAQAQIIANETKCVSNSQLISVPMMTTQQHGTIKSASNVTNYKKFTVNYD